MFVIWSLRTHAGIIYINIICSTPIYSKDMLMYVRNCFENCLHTCEILRLKMNSEHEHYVHVSSLVMEFLRKWKKKSMIKLMLKIFLLKRHKN